MDKRVAIISGGSGSIGTSIANAFTKLGIIVVLLARNEDSLKNVIQNINEKGGMAKYIITDITKTSMIQEAIIQTYNDFGHIDIIVNCAGGGPVGNILDITDEQWSSDISVKQLGCVKLVREAIPYLIKSNGGHIINIIGVFGKQPHPDFIVGSMINAALLAFTKAVADDVAKFKIHVNAINPGATNSELWSKTVAQMAKNADTSLDAINKSTEEASPFNAIAQPNDIANVATFLISDNASFVTGCSINVDGGAFKGIA